MNKYSYSIWATWLMLMLIVISEKASFEFDLDNVSPFSDNSTEQTYQRISDDSLLWGPYRSGIYLGIRPRIPKSLMSGLLWFNVDSHRGILSIRHAYEQGHNLAKANWVNFDPRIGGRQFISDNECHINITIDFVKSNDGKNWGVKVHSVPHEGFEHLSTSFVWYSGLEGEEHDDASKEIVPSGFLKLDNPHDARGYDTVNLSGFSKELGLFEILINDGGKGVSNVHPTRKNLPIPELDTSRAHHMSLRVPDGHVWQGSDIFITLLQDSIKDLADKFGEKASKIPPHQGLIARNLLNYEGNMHFIQKVYQGACEFDITYNAAKVSPSEAITFSNIKGRIHGVMQKLDRKFEKHFPLGACSGKEKEFAKELLSGLLGGLSYFHGDHMVDRTTSLDDDDLPVNINGEVHLPKLVGTREGPFELFSLVPSRPFFPRGFYWDEGFHLLPILEFDSDLALEIIKSWFELVDEEGWIAREQILGDEARSRVPPEFVVQSSAVVNPPTIMLAFTELLERAQKTELQQHVDDLEGDVQKGSPGLILVNDPLLLIEFTQKIYPKLKLHYDSFRKSQQGEVDEFNRGSNKEIYRWRGRTSTHSLASGLDDYPRVLPIDVAELNVDLLCWVGVMTRSIKKVAEVLDIKEDVENYAQIENNIMENIDKFHWSEHDKTYCDASVDDDDEHIFACFKGYISLFPFLTKFVPAESVDKLEHIVDLLADPNELWTEFGIRSLSKSSEYYRTAENYWRSPIWMNINYLVLESLAHYNDVSDNYLSEDLRSKINKVYTSLRKNLINTVQLEWERTGFVWEQYDDQTGSARGAKNFMGWSSLVLLMMSMPSSLN
ncbi:glycoside hydrolase [Metschnikowia bicuspidata var. bicuspidata NRRL YB-4993]|uniref:Mannosyl-oligosaccharide glucosidase n=1 Tax=Metschnikowia bicuspidata var. bicuspidata NRRL YB-4993 TaxID=869754 RepID=A0A1A0H5T2_9ASCO|nr:glycoside hydrolase [Metschnikowia bicuspidata var. bicuspidata NRRL YB-4993]OBA19273.1 glycoside hydrolase [Metschnikowia bicuspidata var. bicuspidata NRRL YB-4993]